MELVEARRYGTFHVANSGSCSRYELAQRAAQIAGLNPALVIGKQRSEMANRAETTAIFRAGNARAETKRNCGAAFRGKKHWKNIFRVEKEEVETDRIAFHFGHDSTVVRLPDFALRCPFLKTESR